MKNRLLIFLFLFSLQYCFGQDIITTKDRKQLNVKVIEQTDKSVRYKMADYQDGPLLMLRTRQIRKIEYKNGYSDLMGYQNPRKERPLGIGAGYAWLPGFLLAVLFSFLLAVALRLLSFRSLMNILKSDR